MHTWDLIFVLINTIYIMVIYFIKCLFQGGAYESMGSKYFRLITILYIIYFPSSGILLMIRITFGSLHFVLLIVPSRYFCGGSFCFMSWCLKFFCAVGALCMFSYF